MSFFSTVVVNKLFHCSVQHAKQVTEYQNRKPQKSSLRGRRKKGRERGREKSTKEGKGKGAPAIRADVFVIRPPFSQLIR